MASHSAVLFSPILHLTASYSDCNSGSMWQCGLALLSALPLYGPALPCFYASKLGPGLAMYSVVCNKHLLEVPSLYATPRNK